MSAPAPLNFALADEAATLALGANLGGALAAQATPGALVYLSGDLGAGKTTLSRGLLRGLGHIGRVKSPTYALVELYVISGLHLYHFDFYRFGDPEEWQEAGFRDLFNATNICLVEWPEKALDLLPPADVQITLATSINDGRTATITASTARGLMILECLLPASTT